MRDTPADHANKVAKASLAFWIMKIRATTVGETGGDLRSMIGATAGLDFGAISSTAKAA